MGKQRANGLIGRCLLAGALALSGASCRPLTYTQEQNMHALTYLAIDHVHEGNRNQAIREAGTASTKRIKTTEIWNLDSMEKEIEIMGWEESASYLENRKNNFPKKGFLVYLEIDDKPFGNPCLVKLINGELKAIYNKDN